MSAIVAMPASSSTQAPGDGCDECQRPVDEGRTGRDRYGVPVGVRITAGEDRAQGALADGETVRVEHAIEGKPQDRAPDHQRRDQPQGSGSHQDGDRDERHGD